MFQAMLVRVREQVTGVLSHIEIRVQRPEEVEPAQPPPRVQALHPEPASALAAAGRTGGRCRPTAAAAAGRPTERTAAVNRDDPATWTGASRNAPCPCGSGRKYKYCHGKHRGDRQIASRSA